MFLGHVMDKRGISPESAKTSALGNMERPKSVTELGRFIGTIKFTPNLSAFSTTSVSTQY